MDGILLFDKPEGWTSHDAVDFVRRHIGQRTVGHAGTLDPMATGLLVMLLGKATKRSQEFSGLDKKYSGEMTFGLTTDTLDREGRILTQSSYEKVTADSVKTAFLDLTGALKQTPPAFSAIKKNGKKLYDLARAGILTVVEPRDVTVHRFELTCFESPKASFEVHCSKGTYIRSLCDEVGKKLGCGAILSKLVRTEIGTMSLDRALTQEKLAALTLVQLQAHLIS